ncbi:pyridoxal-phosphate dependent enzyme [Nonomuraea sp. NEAU-A123]|nr:pyridoxal-phosphate dependent enzyme [Nonomuraea sp. NEAU-A123]
MVRPPPWPRCDGRGIAAGPRCQARSALSWRARNPRFLDDLLTVADDAVLVRESSIIAGMQLLLEHTGLVVEPSAALGVAAVLEDRDRFVGRHVVTVICGSNARVGCVVHDLHANAQAPEGCGGEH